MKLSYLFEEHMMFGRDLLTIRYARREDARVLASMTSALIESAVSQRGTSQRWGERRILGHMRSPNSMVIVAQRRNKIVGFAAMLFHDEEAHLLLLAVTPSERRQGVGRQLLQWLETCALNAGISSVHLEVVLDNHGARFFYLEAGYEELGVMPHYYGRGYAGLRMWKELWKDNM